MRFGDDPKISGTLLISDGVLAGADIPGRENPYAQFVSVRPAAVIDRGVYVYRGQFTLGTVAALEHIRAAEGFWKQQKVADTIREARTAMNLDPNNPMARMILGNALAATGDAMAAQSEYAAALQSSELDPVFQKRLVDELHAKTKH
jgi:thioredoxin-like negative regulator of GroEL